MGQQREGREWAILSEDFESDAEFRDAVAGELASLENMMYRLGRGFVLSPLRREIEVGGARMFETVGVVVSETFMPAVRAAPEPEPEPAGEPEPVEA